MSQSIQFEVEAPGDLTRFQLPEGMQHRLQEVLDKQDGGLPLTTDERQEAEGLVDLAELLSLIRMRSKRVSGEAA